MKLYEQYLPSSTDTLKEAQYKLLEALWMIDTRVIPNRTHCRFVYFFPNECRFIVVGEQLHKYLILKVDPFLEIDRAKTFKIVSYKYSFSTLFVGIFVKRRLIGQSAFLTVVKSHRDWF